MSDVSVNEPTDIASVEPTRTIEVIEPEPRLSAGAQLAVLREARGWTVEQIANQLNLASRQIQALEADNYAALPGMVIVRGFIRAYAKVLRVDPAPILAAITGDSAVPNALPPERNTLSATFSETRLLPGNPRGFRFKAMVGALVLIVLGVTAFVGQRMGWILATPSSTVAAGIEEKLTPVEPVEPEPAAAIEMPEVQPEVVETKKPNVTESAPATLSKPPAVVLAPAPAAVSIPIATAPINPNDALAIRVREDSWVEIKRADNTVVASRLLKAGANEVFEIKGPVSMVIGNAAGVDVTLRGAPVDVVAGNTSNVARLNLK